MVRYLAIAALAATGTLQTSIEDSDRAYLVAHLEMTRQIIVRRDSRSDEGAVVVFSRPRQVVNRAMRGCSVRIAANVHEWCADWYAADYSPYRPSAIPQDHSPGSVAPRVAVRGAMPSRSAPARSRLDPSFRYTDYGFRLAR